MDKKSEAAYILFSDTVHLVNKLETNKRKLDVQWSLHNSVKHLQLSRALSDSIDWDKCAFFEQFNLKSSSECLKLLRCLGFNLSYPSVMSFGNQALYTDSEKASALINSLDLCLELKQPLFPQRTQTDMKFAWMMLIFYWIQLRLC